MSAKKSQNYELDDLYNLFVEQLSNLIEFSKNSGAMFPGLVYATKRIVVAKLVHPDNADMIELIDIIAYEFIGAWIVANSDSNVGEATGLALMGIAPWGEEIQEASGELRDEIWRRLKNSTKLYQELAKKAWEWERP